MLGSPELYRRLAVVVGSLIVYRLGCRIPMPGEEDWKVVIFVIG